MSSSQKSIEERISYLIATMRGTTILYETWFKGVMLCRDSLKSGIDSELIKSFIDALLAVNVDVKNAAENASHKCLKDTLSAICSNSNVIGRT